MGRLIYLASPYSHPSKRVRAQREREVTLYGFRLTRQGFNVITPITASVRMQEYTLKRNPKDTLLSHEEWMRVDLEMLGRCDDLFVLMLPGWQKSRGVTEEIEFALERNIPITYLHAGRKNEV